MYRIVHGVFVVDVGLVDADEVEEEDPSLWRRKVKDLAPDF